MTGANYMGGRRNLAKAKSRDAIRKMQTRHFLRQQHQILNHSLQHSRAALNEVPIQRNRTVDFTFAHARKDKKSHEYTSANDGAMILCKPARGVLLSDSNSSPREEENSRASKSSKILKALNDNNPEKYRSTLDRIARCSDLAGLRRQYKPLSRKSTFSQDPDGELLAGRKRQKPIYERSENVLVSTQTNTYKNGLFEPKLALQIENDASAIFSNAVKEAYSMVKSESNNIPTDDVCDKNSPLDLVSSERQMVLDNDDSQFSALDFIEEFEDLDHEADAINDDYRVPHAPLLPTLSSSPQRYSNSAFERLDISSLPPSSDLPDSRSRSAVSPSLIWQTSTKGEEMNKDDMEYNPEIELLQQSDPWRALDTILSIPTSTRWPERYGDPYRGLDANDRSGVGYKVLDSGQSNAMSTIRSPLIAPSVKSKRSESLEFAELEERDRAFSRTNLGDNDIQCSTHSSQDEIPLSISSGTMFDTLPILSKNDAFNSHEKIISKSTQFPDTCNPLGSDGGTTHARDSLPCSYYTEGPDLGENAQSESTKLSHDEPKEDCYTQETAEKLQTVNKDNGTITAHEFSRHTREDTVPSESRPPALISNLNSDANMNKGRDDSECMEDVIIKGPQLFADDDDDEEF